MSRYKAYAEYKESGVEWLGQTPSHWQQNRMDDIADTQRQQITPRDLQSKIVVHYSIPSVQQFGVGQYEEGETIDSNKFIAQIGDVLFSKLNPRKQTTSIVGSHNELVVTSTEFIVLRPKIGDQKYIQYLLRSTELSDFFCSQVESVTRSHQRINPDVVSKLIFPLPPLVERNKIANFLDHETAKIDALIARQQELIALLQEKRQAVISHAVTKGLNPNATMKDSGVEWAPRIPAHWSASKLRYFAAIANGATPNRDNSLFWEDGSVAWLNSSKVNDGVIRDADQFITEYAKAKTSVAVVKPTDLVMAITGEGQTRGRVAICDLDATINQHLAAISLTSSDLHFEYLHLWLTGNYERIRYESEGAGSTKGAITCADIGAFPVLIPPVEEQKKITEFIAKKNTYFDSLERAALDAVTLMQERRTALISAAVTGKIDVRDWQVPEQNSGYVAATK